MTQKTLNIDRTTLPNASLRIKGTYRKPGTTVMYAFLFGSWLMVALWLLVSIFLLNYSGPWACLMLFSTFAFGWYLRKVDTHLDSLEARLFELKLDSDKVKLDTYDYRTNQHFEKTLYWNEVRWAEVYRYVDEPAVILQGWDSSLEIPIWAFGPQKKAVMQTLLSKKIPIVRIP